MHALQRCCSLDHGLLHICRNQVRDDGARGQLACARLCHNRDVSAARPCGQRDAQRVLEFRKLLHGTRKRQLGEGGLCLPSQPDRPPPLPTLSSPLTDGRLKEREEFGRVAGSLLVPQILEDGRPMQRQRKVQALHTQGTQGGSAKAQRTQRAPSTQWPSAAATGPGCKLISSHTLDGVKACLEYCRWWLCSPWPRGSLHDTSASKVSIS